MISAHFTPHLYSYSSITQIVASIYHNYPSVLLSDALSALIIISISYYYHIIHYIDDPTHDYVIHFMYNAFIIISSHVLILKASIELIKQKLIPIAIYSLGES
jgi:hypothetical protein